MQKMEFQNEAMTGVVIKVDEYIQCGDVWLVKFYCPYCSKKSLAGVPFLECQECKQKLSNLEVTDGSKRYLAGTKRKTIGKKIIKKLLQEQSFSCAYCFIDLSGTNFDVDHIFPVSLGGNNALSNLAVSCKQCNMAAGSKFFMSKEAKGIFIRSKRGV
jgi:hypothetical protein